MIEEYSVKLIEIHDMMNMKRIMEMVSENNSSNLPAGVASVLDSLELAYRSAYITIRQAEPELAELLKWRDPSRVMVVMGPAYKWLNANFETGKVSGSGYGVRSNLLKLAQYKPNLKNSIETFLKVDMKHVADRSNSTEKSTESKFFDSLDFLRRVLKSAKPSFKDDGFESTVERVRTLLSELRRIKQKDSGVDRETADKLRGQAPDNADSSKALIGKQNQQVEIAINQILSGVPKDKAADIRRRMAKVDNKLQFVFGEVKKLQNA